MQKSQKPHSATFVNYFLFDLFVDYMSGCQFCSDVIQRDSHFNHQHHQMVHQIGNFVNGFSLVAALCTDDDLCALFTDLFENLVYAFFKEVGCVGTFLFLCFAASAYFSYFSDLVRRVCPVGVGFSP